MTCSLLVVKAFRSLKFLPSISFSLLLLHPRTSCHTFTIIIMNNHTSRHSRQAPAISSDEEEERNRHVDSGNLRLLKGQSARQRRAARLRAHESMFSLNRPHPHSKLTSSQWWRSAFRQGHAPPPQKSQLRCRASRHFNKLKKLRCVALRRWLATVSSKVAEEVVSFSSNSHVLIITDDDLRWVDRRRWRRRVTKPRLSAPVSRCGSTITIPAGRWQW